LSRWPSAKQAALGLGVADARWPIWVRGASLRLIAEVQILALIAQTGTSSPVQHGKQGDTIISVFDDPNGIARFLLHGLPADERQHVIDVIRRQEIVDLKRLRVQGGPVSPAEIVAVISLVDTVTVPPVSVTEAAA
jgi:hypothetical protein